MKKIISAVTLAFMLAASLPVGAAEAASLGDALVQMAAAQSPAGTVAAQLLQVQDALKRRDTNALLQMAARTALEKAGKGDLAQAADALAGGQDFRSALQAMAKQRIEQAAGPYAPAISLLSQLFENSKGTPQGIPGGDSVSGAPAQYVKKLSMTATAYSPGYRENGRWNNLTYLGGKVRKGVVAVDPTVIPLGTHLWVEGYGPAVAEDIGSAIKGSRIDLAFPDRQQALDYGIKEVKVYVLRD